MVRALVKKKQGHELVPRMVKYKQNDRQGFGPNHEKSPSGISGTAL